MNYSNQNSNYGSFFIIESQFFYYLISIMSPGPVPLKNCPFHVLPSLSMYVPSPCILFSLHPPIYLAPFGHFKFDELVKKYKFHTLIFLSYVYIHEYLES
jgi:hypothetical protein